MRTKKLLVYASHICRVMKSLELHETWILLGNYSSWLVTRRFRFTRKEPEFLTDIRDFTTLFYVILRNDSNHSEDLRIESDLGIGMWFAIWTPSIRFLISTAKNIIPG